MIEWIFWDNDGVLVDTEELYFRANQDTLAELDIDLTRDRFIQISMIEGRSVFDLAAAQGVDAITIDKLHDDRNRCYVDLLKKGVNVHKGVLSALKRLHRNFSMGMVTSCRKKHLDIIHADTDLLRFFDFILTGDHVSHTKPNPEPYLKALAKSGCPAKRCIVVEDSVRGVASAKAAGIQCLALPNGLTAECDFSHADEVLNNIEEVAAFILKKIR